MSKLNMKYSNFVSRNEAINALLKQERLTPSIIRRVLMQIAGADVVEVVRCKDCKHRRNDEDYASGHYCVKRPSNGGYFCEDDDFCSYGEPKKDR